MPGEFEKFAKFFLISSVYKTKSYALLLWFLGGHKRKSLSEISKLYKELSTKIFTQSTIKGTSNLVWSHAYYDTQLWEKLLQDHLGNRDLIKTTRDRIAPKVIKILTVFGNNLLNLSNIVLKTINYFKFYESLLLQKHF